MKNKGLLKLSLAISLIVALAVAFPIVSNLTAQAAEEKGETINIGFLAALSGPDAGWGLPGLTGNQIYIDRVNAQGGLLVGGKRHPLKMYAFDDEAIGSKALQGAKELVLRRKVKFISAIGGNPADATHPWSADSWILYTRELYRLVSSRLNETGIFCQWIPLHWMSSDDFKCILRTMRTAFPHLSLWYTGSYVVALGYSQPVRPDPSGIERRMRPAKIQSRAWRRA